MIQDFEIQQGFNPEKRQACFHGILSFYPGENPGDDKIQEIARKYLEGLNIRDTQIAIFKHTDKAHLHVHLIANMVDRNGKSISDRWIGMRGKKARATVNPGLQTDPKYLYYRITIRKIHVISYF